MASLTGLCGIGELDATEKACCSVGTQQIVMAEFHTLECDVTHGIGGVEVCGCVPLRGDDRSVQPAGAIRLICVCVVTASRISGSSSAATAVGLRTRSRNKGMWGHVEASSILLRIDTNLSSFMLAVLYPYFETYANC